MDQASQVQFGAWLKQQRKSRRLTQEDLAERLSCSSVLVQKIEAGERIPSAQLASLIGDWLVIPADDRAAFLDFARGQSEGREAASRFTPAPTARQPGLGSLPVPLTPLIGRASEVQAVQNLLLGKDVRLLTLTGPPGIGKTRLALEVARLTVGHFRDGGFFVGLASVVDPDLVLAAIALALGIPNKSTESLLHNLQQWLSGRQALLLLDNFEQVLDAAPDILEVLSACPHLKILTTSREALYVQGEQQFHVPPLATADPASLPPIEAMQSVPAVALFLERAEAVKPDFVLTEHNAGAVAVVCAHLQGLPLAIELAAARVNLFSPQEMQSRLDNTLILLDSASRRLPSKQRTLREAIDWSYNLLNDAERSLFAQLGVFIGGCTLDAAEAVCNAHGDTTSGVLKGLASLVNKSLLQRVEDGSGASRFTMLETVHEYARQKLHEMGEKEAFAKAHALYFVKLAEEAEPHLRGAKQSEWFHRLEDEHDNIQAALNWARYSKENERNRESEQIEPIEIGLRIAGAISRFWYVRGNFSNGREHLEALLSTSTQLGSLGLRTCSKQSVANALNGLGSLAYSQGDYAPARARYEEALSIGRELGHKQIIASSLNGLGNVAIEQGDYAVARSLYEESLALNKQLEDRWGISISLLNLGVIAHVQGDYRRARALYEESLVVARQSEDKSGIAIIVGNLGAIATIHGDYPRARALQEESLLLRRELGDKSGIASALKELGNVALQEADYAAARCLYEEGLAIERELGEVRSVANSLGKLGNIAFMERDYAQMILLYRQCLMMFKKLGDKDNIAWCIAELGAVAAVTGHAEQGARMMAAAEVLFQLTGGVMHFSDRLSYERGLASARAQLGEAGFEGQWQEGKAMTMEQAIDYARETP